VKLRTANNEPRTVNRLTSAATIRD
jgi:hypothetical protein